MSTIDHFTDDHIRYLLSHLRQVLAQLRHEPPSPARDRSIEYALLATIEALEDPRSLSQLDHLACRP